MDAFYGEIRVFAGNYAPENWMFCAGQHLSIPQYNVLYAVIGDIYGGDARTYFQLPDLRGRTPLHFGYSQGPGLSPYYLGEMTGQATKALNISNMPTHSHTMHAVNAPADETAPTTNHDSMLARGRALSGPPASRNKPAYAPYPDTSTSIVQMPYDSLSVTGINSSQTSTNMQPHLVSNFIICVENGVFPARS
ncbi:MAG: phage tail protein [Alphaproteobacteria bacterium]|nr:MAG: phage tail protein [Alphaproteobacteria bacterium]